MFIIPVEEISDSPVSYKKKNFGQQYEHLNPATNMDGQIPLCFFHPLQSKHPCFNTVESYLGGAH